MAQVGGNGVFWGKTCMKRHRKEKEKMWDALTYIRMLTDLRQVPDVTGSGAKMAQVVEPDFHNGFLNKI